MSRNGLRNISSLLLILGLSLPLLAADSYKKVFKNVTRQAKDFTLENFEMRLSWNATYLSPEFRRARRERLASLLKWLPEERGEAEQNDGQDLKKYDDFFMAVYSGSGAHREIGEDVGLWRIVLETGGKTVKPSSMERVRITQTEGALFPYLDSWSKAYRLRFPKTIREGESFTVRMQGIPADSVLRWGEVK